MKLSDLKGLLKKSELEVESVENPFGDYYILKLKNNEGMTWRAGEHGIFTLPNNSVEGKKWRAFSVASIPEEGVMMIGTRIGEKISSYKKNLTSLKKNDKVSVRGPFGWFYLQDDTTHLVMIASGVGITPIRALLKELEKGNNRQVDIIYAAEKYYLFEEEIKLMVAKDPKINLNFTESTEETQAEIKAITKQLGNGAYYYISGSPNMIKSTKKLIQSEGVKGKQILNDPFFGY